MATSTTKLRNFVDRLLGPSPSWCTYMVRLTIHLTGFYPKTMQEIVECLLIKKKPEISS